MTSNRINFVFLTSVTATAMVCGPLAEVSLAQGGDTPPVAPSFLRQAGQAIFNRAQNGMIHNLNERMQGAPNQAAPGTPAPNGGTFPQGMPGAIVNPAANQAPHADTQAAPCRSWANPQEKPIACLLCIHGLGLQSNSYEFFGNEQSKRGLAVYAIDVRGFGAWMNAGGKTKIDFNQCLEDIKQTLQSIRAANPGLPVYILGESMGGAIALRAASMYPDLIDGLVSSVPAGERFKQERTSAKVFLNLLTGLNIANVGNDLVNQATQNAKLRTQWKDDPLSRLNLSPQELIQFQDFMNSNHDAAAKVKDMPVLFLQGNGDQLVKPEGTWELFNDVAAKDKSFFAVPGEHLIFEDAETQDAGPRDQNFRVINSWLSTKVGHRHRGDGGSRMAGAMGGGAGNGSGYNTGRGPNIDTRGLEVQAQMIDAGQNANAISALEQINLQRPNDPNVLALLGKAYFQNGQQDKAFYLFRAAMRLRRGGDQANSLNSYLLQMSQNSPNGFSPASGGTIGFTPGPKAKVYAFYASWADQCKGLSDSLSQLTSSYGDRVDITRVDIDNSASDALVNQFKVGPIPTVVFVSPNGQVSSTIIGASTYQNYEAAIRNMTQPARQTF